MLRILDKTVRRLFAWPLTLIGIVLIHAGGGLVIAGAWTLDFNIKEILDAARR